MSPYRLVGHTSSLALRCRLGEEGSIPLLWVVHGRPGFALIGRFPVLTTGPADARLPGGSISNPFDGLCLAIKDLALEPRFGGDPAHFIANAFFRIEDHQSELSIGHGPSSCDKPNRDPQT